MKQILLAANDFAPSTILGKLGNLIEQDNNTSVMRAFGNELTTSGLTALASNPGVLVCGMAHSEEASKDELALITEAYECGVPVVLYADTWGCALRPWFSGVRHMASILFVVSEDDKKEATPHFPSTEIVVAGNPLWEAAAFPKTTRGVARARLGIRADEYVILATCVKRKDINTSFLMSLGRTSALLSSSNEAPSKVLVSVHPKAENYDAYAVSLPAMMPEARLVSGPVSDIIPAADVVVNTASGAGIEAVYQRKPLIEFVNTDIEDDVERLYGTRVWRLIQAGVAIPVRTSHELEKELKAMRSGLRTEVRVRMEKYFPLPASPDTALLRMHEVLSELLI